MGDKGMEVLLEGQLPSQTVKAVLRMLWSVLGYILAYSVFAVLLSSLYVDACVVQAMSGIYVVWRCWKNERKKGIDYLEVSGFKNYQIPKQEILALAGLGFALNCFIGGAINLLPVDAVVAADYMEMSAAPVKGVHPFLAFFVIAFVAPVVEEAFFRGTLLRRLKAEINPFYALILVSLVFGLMHGQILWICYASVLGLVLGLIYLLYDSIYPSMIVHISFNLVSGIPMILNPSGMLYRLTFGNFIFLWLMAVGGFAAVTWILFQIYFPRFMNLKNRT